MIARTPHAGALVLAAVIGGVASAQAPLFRTSDPVAGSHGVVLDGIGDVNMNGSGDVAVGEPRDFGALPTFPPEGGALWIYDGFATGPATGPCGAATGVADSPGATVVNTLYGPAAFDHFGTAVLGVGDVTGDGVPDLMMTAGEGNIVGPNVRHGRVLLYSGASLVSGVPNPAPIGVISGGVTPTATSPQSAFFGSHLNQIGDWTGDGISEVLIGAPLGNGSSPSLLSIGYVRIVDPTTLSTLLRIDGPSYGSWFGHTSTMLEDWTGDGIPEFAVGAPLVFNGVDFGQVHVYEGGTGASLQLLDTTASGELFSWSMTTLDANGDGFRDLAVGQPGFGSGYGHVRVFDGISVFGATPVELANWNPGSTLVNPYIFGLFDRFGQSIDNMGDLDGDGVDDLIVGTATGSNWDPDNLNDVLNWPSFGPEFVDSGAAYLMSGATGNVLKIYSEACGSNDVVGEAVRNVGDLDADGVDDLGIGGALTDFGGVVDAGVARFYSGAYRIGIPYGPANPNSSGVPARISATGSASISANDLTLICTGLPGVGAGEFFFGPGQQPGPTYPTFYNGFLLVTGGIHRLPPLLSVTGSTITYQVDLTMPAAAALVLAGSRLYFQFWYNDPGTGRNTSDGLDIGFLP